MRTYASKFAADSHFLSSSRNETLKGAESQRLRTYFSSQEMIPARDVNDPLGRAVLTGNLSAVKEVLAARTAVVTPDAASTDVAQDVSTLQWGPTRVPIFNLILLCTILVPERRNGYLSVAKWLAAPRPEGAGVPVDGRDLAGYTALMHSMSTKPSVDPELADILYAAGADTNARNRFGCTLVHEICTIWSPAPRDAQRAEQALRWFLSHGGNMWIADTDGVAPWSMVRNAQRAGHIPAMARLAKIMDAEHERRRVVRGTVCEFCGRKDAERLLLCSRCKEVRYCAPPGRSCQKVRRFGRNAARADDCCPCRQTGNGINLRVSLHLEHLYGGNR